MNEKLQYPEYRVGSTLDFLKEESEDGTQTRRRIVTGSAIQFREKGTDDIVEVQMSLEGATRLGMELIQVSEQGTQTDALVTALIGDQEDPNYDTVIRLLERISAVRTGTKNAVEVRPGTMTEDEIRNTSRKK